MGVRAARTRALSKVTFAPEANRNVRSHCPHELVFEIAFRCVIRVPE